VIPHALANRDILCASKTGSGKTLAFLIPMIENLYRQKWNVLDGLGGLVICPTRELAMQVFEVLKTINEYHELSIGLIIGGKSLEIEQRSIYRMNIVICTPGRIL
jgi:ATP-dependent RNA helicase DDX10/DBP4